MTSTTRTFRRGDKVTPDPDAMGVPPATLGRVFTVEKVNPKNLRCSADDGGRGINFPASLLLPATDENVAKGRGDSSVPGVAIGRPFVPREFFSAGEIVTITEPYRDLTTQTPMVVLKDDGRNKVNVTRLGGDDGRYLRCSPQGLVKRDAEWLAEALVESLPKA